MNDKQKNVKHFPQEVRTNQELISDALALGCNKAKVIPTKSITLSQWVKLQCQFGCPHYARLFTCPPCTPTTHEMSEILMDYNKALLVKGGSDMREIVVSLEGQFKKKGFFKAFALCSTPCDLCEPCTIETRCQYPEKARPTLQACGINVNETVTNNGWTDEVPGEPCSREHDIAMVLLD